MALMDVVYRGACFCLPRCRDGRCLIGFARVLLPRVYVLLLFIISVCGFLPVSIDLTYGRVSRLVGGSFVFCQSSLVMSVVIDLVISGYMCTRYVMFLGTLDLQDMSF